MKKLFLALCVCAGLCACSDDVIEGTSSSVASLDADQLYMTVRIQDVNSATRAEDGGYKNGSSLEYAVDNAYFYFYDEDGLFVSRAEVWDGGTPTTNDEGTNPIEFKGETVVVLKGLTEVGFPRYMVTVLNEPKGFEGTSGYYEPAATLEEMQKLLSSQTSTGIYDSGESGNFVMSTSSYWTEDATADTGDSRDPYYFVTEIPDNAFYVEPVDLKNSTPVDVYVERLAAKVQLTVNADLAATATENGRYLLKETVGGDENEEDDQDPDDVTEGDGEGVQDIYIEILGWALNATARQSYMLKNIESTTTWTNEEPYTLGFAWNNAEDHRSFWGMSYNYGIDVAYPTTNVNPTTGDPNTDSDETDASTWLNQYLKYTSLAEGNLLEIDEDVDYCAENTNTAGDDGILQSPYSSAITHVLVKAQAYASDDAEDPLELVRYRGELYTVAGFWNYVNERIGAFITNYNLLYFSDTDYTNAGDVDPDEMTPISDGDFLYVENQGDGIVYVELNAAAMQAEGIYWYVYNNGNYYELQATELATTITDIDSSLDSEINTYAINWFTDGLMYYAIPIEHLNNTDYIESQSVAGTVYALNEANFGVVRNHWYQLDITDIANVGKGIYDDEEVIIPDPEDEVYLYVTSDVHILSWQMVSQSVEL